MTAFPQNYRRITPALVVRGAAQALEFYTAVFGARVRGRTAGPDGTSVAHAELEIGDSVLIVEDEDPERGTRAPATDGPAGSPAYQLIYVPDVDATMTLAAELGAVVERKPEDRFHGDRDGFLVDPFGHGWTVATRTFDQGFVSTGRR
jgi:PhnB protein